MTKHTHKLTVRSISVGRLILACVATLIWCSSAFSAMALRSITLGWNASNGQNLAGYYVYTHEENALLSTRQDAGPYTQATIHGLKEGLNYRFAVTAYNSLGLESPPSEGLHYFVPVPLQLLRPTPSTPQARLRFPMVPGRWYELQASPDLKSWQTLWQTGGALFYTTANYTDQRSNLPRAQFYRLIIH